MRNSVRFLIFIFCLTKLTTKTTTANKQECGPEAKSLGQTRKSGAKWDWSDSDGVPYECRCGWHVWVRQHGDPYIGCWPKGCRENRYTGKYYPPHSKNARGCICLPGTDPHLADSFTLYHWSCRIRECSPEASSLYQIRKVDEKWDWTDSAGVPLRCTCYLPWREDILPYVSCYVKDKGKKRLHDFGELHRGDFASGKRLPGSGPILRNGEGRRPWENKVRMDYAKSATAKTISSLTMIIANIFMLGKYSLYRLSC